MQVEFACMITGLILWNVLSWILGLSWFWTVIGWPIGYLVVRTILIFWCDSQTAEPPEELKNLWDEGYEEGQRRLKEHFARDLNQKQDPEEK